MNEITVNLKRFKEAVEAIWLRGKYKSSTASKVDVISDIGIGLVKRNLTLANANHTIAACIRLGIDAPISRVDGGEEDFMFIFDIEKVVKYLKVFKSEDLVLKISESQLILQDENSKSTMKLAVEHSNFPFISRITSLTIPGEGLPKIGLTQLDTCLIFDGNDLARVIKQCNIVGTATYKIDFDGEHCKVSSSNFQGTEHFESKLPLTGHQGKESTVEFTAPIDKFCTDGTMFLYMGDDKPILLFAPTRQLLMAPYVKVR